MSDQKPVAKNNESTSFLKKMLLGENIYSLIFYLVIFYVLLAYVIFPATYTFTPISDVSAVISSSMVHQQPQINVTYYGWLQSHGFNMSQVAEWPFPNGLPLGSLVVAYKVPANDIKIGNIIIYRADVNGEYIDVIHRVINETVVNGVYHFTTKGDANPYPLSFEYNVPYNEVVGKVVLSIPYLGYPRYLVYLLFSGL
ncbi:signal peptidase I [Candidatus Parvarchaeota archaeon]|nr:signal peptidase I [Candidatus Acidifodinimicrobium mancum]